MKDITKEGPRTFWFVIITLLYLICVPVGAWWLGYFTRSQTPIEPNEWGDVLAGVFSPLAFLWLIYASLSQRAELHLQGKELIKSNRTQDAQHDEMRKQVEALTAQSELLRAQAAATFDPVFVVSEVYKDCERSRTALSIVNFGSSVMNVYIDSQFVAIYYEGNVKGIDSENSKVYYWAEGAKVLLHKQSDDDGLSVSHKISIQYTRKDGTTKRNVYLFSNTKQGLDLIQSDHSD